MENGYKTLEESTVRISELTPMCESRWSLSAQQLKTIEEMSELTQRLTKELNGIGRDEDFKTVDEIADVLIMTLQLRYFYGREAVDRRIDYKLDRLERILKGSESHTHLAVNKSWIKSSIL